MKYIVIIGDGMADYPVLELDNKTPLQYASTPNMDFLARHGEIGLVNTIPEKTSPGSDIANLSVLGYNPLKYYSGRAPLEAVSMGIELSEDDTAFRCNLVTLSDENNYFNKVMVDYCSDEITSVEAAELIDELNKHFKTDLMVFHPGISYRHCMVWTNPPAVSFLTPPHDILDKRIGNYLKYNDNTKLLFDIMIESNRILKNHPVNRFRISKGLNPANSIWLWGEGKKPTIPEFNHKYGLKGSVISAVDLIKGIGICAGLKSIDVEGATGNINTNYLNKANAALNELKSGQDFVFVHIEAPDECGHRNEIFNKVKSIEFIDDQIVGTILKGLTNFDDYRVLILPDHPTPLSLRTHTTEPVPFLIYQKTKSKDTGILGYDEFTAEGSNLLIKEGHTLMDYFLQQRII